MFMPAFAVAQWTEVEFYASRDAAPRGERWELVDGEVLVTPSPHWTHQNIVFELAVRLRAYVMAEGIGKILVSPLDVKLEAGLVMQPDILAVPEGHLRAQGDVVTTLLLAVESVSPSSARFDRVVKRPRYQRNNVPEYWIVDGEAQIIERWQPGDERPAIISGQLNWHPEGAAEPFVLDLPSFFRETLPVE